MLSRGSCFSNSLIALNRWYLFDTIIPCWRANNGFKLLHTASILHFHMLVRAKRFHFFYFQNLTVRFLFGFWGFILSLTTVRLLQETLTAVNVFILDWLDVSFLSFYKGGTLSLESTPQVILRDIGNSVLGIRALPRRSLRAIYFRKRDSTSLLGDNWPKLLLYMLYLFYFVNKSEVLFL